MTEHFERGKQLHEEMLKLYKRGDELRSLEVVGKPIAYWGEIRNQCWNCENFTKIPNILLQFIRGDRKLKRSKGYYKCNHCGAVTHL